MISAAGRMRSDADGLGCMGATPVREGRADERSLAGAFSPNSNRHVFASAHLFPTRLCKVYSTLWASPRILGQERMRRDASAR